MAIYTNLHTELRSAASLGTLHRRLTIEDEGDEAVLAGWEAADKPDDVEEANEIRDAVLAFLRASLEAASALAIARDTGHDVRTVGKKLRVLRADGLAIQDSEAWRASSSALTDSA